MRRNILTTLLLIYIAFVTLMNVNVLNDSFHSPFPILMTLAVPVFVFLFIINERYDLVPRRHIQKKSRKRGEQKSDLEVLLDSMDEYEREEFKAEMKALMLERVDRLSEDGEYIDESYSLGEIINGVKQKRH